jgi:hypothetical protein
VSRILSASFSFYGTSWIWTSGTEEDVFLGPFSSSICTVVLRDTSGLSSSSYIFICVDHMFLCSDEDGAI